MWGHKGSLIWLATFFEAVTLQTGQGADPAAAMFFTPEAVTRRVPADVSNALRHGMSICRLAAIMHIVRSFSA